MRPVGGGDQVRQEVLTHNFSAEDFAPLPGKWSLWPVQVSAALNQVDWEKVSKRSKQELRILEFGAGKGTQVIHQVLTRMGIRMNYLTYENNPKYVPDVLAGLMCVRYTTPSAVTNLKGVKRDIVFIDGPNGVARSLWYPKMRGVVGKGTILVIDDYSHYESFQVELAKNFGYEILDRKELGRRGPNGEKASCKVSWMTVRILDIKRSDESWQRT